MSVIRAGQREGRSGDREGETAATAERRACGAAATKVQPCGRAATKVRPCGPAAKEVRPCGPAATKVQPRGADAKAVQPRIAANKARRNPPRGAAGRDPVATRRPAQAPARRAGAQPALRVPLAESHPDRILAACDGVIDIVAALFNVSGKELREPGRSTLAVSRVRQIAMYAAHVTLGFTMGHVGQGFGRDRTTVLHACHQIEDLREDAEFDRIVARVEQVVAAAFGGQG